MMKTKGRRSIPMRLALLHLMVILVVLILIIILLVVTTRGFFDINVQIAKRRHSLDAESAERSESGSVCSSPKCVQLSGEILSRMDLTVNPCDDFYEYACGGFIRSPLVPTDSSKWGTTSVMDKTNKFLVKQMLEQPIQGGSSNDAVNKAKLMYKSCLAVPEDAGQRLQSVIQMLKVVGSWPIVTPGLSWSEDTWQFETALAIARKRYTQAIFWVYVSEDDRNNTFNRLNFNQATSFFPDATAFNGSKAASNRAALDSLVIRLVQLLGGDEESARAILDDLWHLDKALAEIKLTLIEYRADVRKRYNLMTLQELQTLIGPGLNISLFLDELFEEHIPLTETVIVRVPTMFAQLGQVLSKAKKSTLATYISMQALWDNAHFASLEFRDAIEDFKAKLAGGKNEVPRWQSCITDTVDALGFAVSALFTEDHFTTADKREVVQLLENIRESFLDSIPSLAWMDDVTKASAVEKATKVSHKVGFPDFIRSKDKLDEYYSDLVITDDHFQNQAAEFRYSSLKNLQKRGQKVDQGEWPPHTSPTVVNAFYDPQKNDMIFPAGILQKPIYHSAYPRALSYGAVGTIMGHELTHGFDTSGRRYDPDGNLFNWWGNISAREFEHRTQCLVDQYNKYELKGMKMSGGLTLAENIADNGGLRLSYRAYQTWRTENEDTKLVGLNLGLNQMFFLGQAQTLCTVIKPSFVAHILRNDVHSPAKFRVLATMQNMEQFSEAFGCPKGSPMNPDNKCVIWT